MKKTLLLFNCIALFLNGFTQDIATARQQAEGSTVTVSGIVTNGNELGSPIRYIQDQTAGIAIYDPATMEGVNKGDSISVTGVLVDYNGLLEIQPVNELINHGSGYTISPELITPNQIGEDSESELISIENVVFENAGQIFSVGTYNFNSEGQSGVIYIKAGSALENTLAPSCPVKMTAISSQYSFTGFDGYQLLIRDENDFEYDGGICLTSAVTQNNITTTSFDVSWTTNFSAYSNIYYGLTPELEIGVINGDGSVSTEHSISLENLEPATIYYVQAFSDEGTDTAFSAVYAFATQSNSTGDIRVCFNSSVDISVATIQNAQFSGVYTNDTIKKYIDMANHTLDVAIYNHSDNLITTAINDAHERGVRVRYITCESTTTTALGSLNNGIQTLERPETMGIMHNKFIVIDADIVDSSWVISGSTNWTSSQIFDDPNHIIMVQDQSVARTYELEFNEMWGSNTDIPNVTNAKFGSEKSDNTPHHFLVNGKPFEVYFSPSDNTTFNISEAIKTADVEIDFGLLVFTNNQLANTIVERHDDGVEVNGIIEQVNTQGTEYDFLLEQGINVLSHQGFGDQFHHKYCIIDHGDVNSDPTVVSGSHNWSGAAETNNDENTMIIHDANIANQFYQEFHQRLNELENQVEQSYNCINEACVDPQDGSGTYSSLASCENACSTIDLEENLNKQIIAYPNPSNGNFKLEIITNKSENITYSIFDIHGKVVIQESLTVYKGLNNLNVNESLNAGIYFVEIGSQRIKIAIQ